MQNETVLNIREYMGMSQEEFSKWIGTSRSAIGLIETGQRNVSRTVQAKIARKFSVTDEFIWFCENKKKLSI
jgi:DNA-binding XRE family transcriptional regulator